MAKYEAYIDSGFEWLGQIPASWKMVLLSQVVTQVKNKNSELMEQNLLSLSYGRIKRKPIDTSGGLLPESFDGYNIIEANDIVLRLTDLQNDHRSLRVGLASERGIITSAYTTMRPRNQGSAKYLYYLLHTFDIRKGFYGMGSGVRQGLNYDEVKKMKLPMPTLAEQAAIAEYLDRETERIDAIIAEAKASIEEYKAWKASIIYEAVTKGLAPNAEMKDSGITWIGRMPASWKTMRIKDLGDARNGLTYSPEEQVDEGKGILVLRSSNVQGGKLVFTDNVYIGSEIPSELMLQQGDILICSRNGSRKLIGKNAYIEEDNKYSFGAFMMALRPKIRNKKYVYWLLNSGVFGYYLPMFFTSTINQLTRENFRNMVVPYCDDEFVQKGIVEYLDTKVAQIDSVIEDKERLIDDMEHYKKSLIFEVVTGKRKVV